MGFAIVVMAAALALRCPASSAVAADVPDATTRAEDAARRAESAAARSEDAARRVEAAAERLERLVDKLEQGHDAGKARR